MFENMPGSYNQTFLEGKEWASGIGNLLGVGSILLGQQQYAACDAREPIIINRFAKPELQEAVND